MKNTLPFGLVIISILLSSISLSRAKVVPRSNEDVEGDDDYYDYESREQPVSQNPAEIHTSSAIITASTTLPVGATNTAIKTKNYNYDNINGLDLKLDGPQVDLVEYTCPTDCQCSKGTLVVNCSERSLTQIPNGIPKNVHKLILSGNSLKIIEAEAFSDLTDIHEIILARNQIESIENNAFNSRLVHLDHIDLSSNHLTKLDPDLFVDLPKLRKLSLNSNNLTITENEVLLKQPILEELNLAGCNIDQLYELTFAQLPGLQRLQLANNPLDEDMDINVFDPIEKVQNLSMPQLDEDTIFKLCEKLTSIDVINFETFDVSCFELVSGQTFEESVVTIKTISHSLTAQNNEIEAPNIDEQGTTTTTEKVVAPNSEEPATAIGTFKIEQPSTSMVSDARKDLEISLSDVEVDTSSTHNTTSSQDEPPRAVSSISTDTINKMLIGIIIIAVCGLVIGVICRRDCFGIKTKMCRTRRRSPPADRAHIRPSEEVPLNKMTNNQQ